MFDPKEHETTSLHILRLVARGTSILCLAVILLFLVGEGFNFGDVTWKQWIGLAFFPVGLIVGLVLAWREEGLGGAIAVGSILGIYLVYGWLLNGTLRLGWAFLPFLIPGILFLAYRLVSGIPQSSEKLAH
jgi:hypothetical protein